MCISIPVYIYIPLEEENKPQDCFWKNRVAKAQAWEDRKKTVPFS